MAIKITEREVAADLAGELDHLLKQGSYPFQKTTVESHASSGYPDITVWTDYAAQQAFASWKLKAPGLKEDLSKLPQKSQNLGVSFVVVWNFQHGTLYEIMPDGSLHPLKSYPKPLLNTLDEWKVVPKRLAVIQQARQILDDLDHLYQQGTVHAFVPDKIYFISILQKAVRELHPLLQRHLFDKKKDTHVRQQVNRWAVKQGIPTGTPDLDDTIARQWAYSLALRILFYFTVRRHYRGLPDLKPLPGSAQPVADLLQNAFSKAQAVDWQAVFEPSPLDQLGFPAGADPVLDNLLRDFHRYDFSLLKEDVIGEILEGLIPDEERHALGQYFTREDLVDFIIGFVADHPDAAYLDPTCGSGTFLNRLYSRLRWLSTYRASHADLLERLWGVDIAHFPAELATINLFRQDVKDVSNFPRVITEDFFRIQPGQTFQFPPPKAIAPDYPKVQVPMPTFHGLVGNFPYIRQELTERQNPGYKRQITQAIALEWFWNDRDIFTLKRTPEAEVEAIAARVKQEQQKWLETQVQKGRIDLHLSGQADIYAYLFLHAAAFLPEGGRIGVVTSNSWLDVAYGLELKRFFLRHFKVVAVVASWAEPWFEDAAINTVFTILERCKDPEQRANNLVRFVKVKRPLAELLPRDLLLKEHERWLKVDALVNKVRMADAQLATWNTAGEVEVPKGINAVEDADLRIRLVRQADLETEVQAQGKQAKWGPYLRAPQVYFDLLKETGSKLVPLTKVAEVRRGYTTGINDFFYLQPLGPGKEPGTLRVRNGRGYECEIEEACLRPIIKSPKEAQSIVIDPGRLRYRLFLPPGVGVILPDEGPKDEPQLRDELLESGWTGAREYVEWGAQQQTSRGVPWPQVPSVRGRKAWWLLREATRPDGMWPKSFNDRFAVFVNEGNVLASDRMYEIVVKEGIGETLLWALLNSTVMALLIELNSRVNLGEGALDNMVYEAAQCPIPDPAQVSPAMRKKILSAYEKLKRRPVKPIVQEVKRKDRQALDAAVLEALGLNPLLYQQRIYDGLVEMVQERLALPKMRRRRKKRTRRMSREQVKQQVRKEVLPGGLKPIASFLPGPKPALMSVPVTGRPVSWLPFITQQTLMDADGKEVGTLTGDEVQARYAVYATRPGQYTLKVPADPMAAGKAVQGYEQYLHQVGRDLFSQAPEAMRDYKQAERATREILASFGLPPLALEAAMG